MCIRDRSTTDDTAHTTDEREGVDLGGNPAGNDSADFRSVDSYPADSDSADSFPAGSDSADDAAARSRRRGVSGTLAANPMRVVLAAVVIGALVAGGIAFALGVFTDNGNVGTTDIGENERLTENAFTRSVAGDCLDWPDAVSYTHLTLPTIYSV